VWELQLLGELGEQDLKGKIAFQLQVITFASSEDTREEITFSNAFCGSFASSRKANISTVRTSVFPCVSARLPLKEFLFHLTSGLL